MMQVYGAMVKCGMTPKDLVEMDASKDKDDVVAFMNTVFSGGVMDQLQTPYYYDYVMHSISPVAECIATANLKPVPGVIEYVPGKIHLQAPFTHTHMTGKLLTSPLVSRLPGLLLQEAHPLRSRNRQDS